MDVGKVNCVLGLDPKRYSRCDVLLEIKNLVEQYKHSSDADISEAGVFRRIFAAPLTAHSTSRHFSLFVDQDLVNSDTLIKQIYKTSSMGKVLELVYEKLSNIALHPLLIKYSLATAINHAPQFQSLKQQVPQALVIAPNHVFCDQTIPKRWTNPDDLLKWWREDPMLNSHHWNWHTAYPSFGVSLDGTPAKLKDRQGELFVFMHRQMVARYDCERTALGIESLDPFGSNTYKDSLGESFDPLLSTFVSRQSGSVMKDNVKGTHPFDTISLVDLEIWRQRLLEAIQNRKFKKTITASDGSMMTSEIPMTIADLGSSLEATMGSPNKAYYGNLNKQAHNLMARVSNTRGDEQNNLGIMGDIIGAFRDPLFWRWHKHLDDFFHRFEIASIPHKLEETAPPQFKVSKVSVKNAYVPQLSTNPVTKELEVSLQPNKNPQENYLSTYMKSQIIDIKKDGHVVSHKQSEIIDHEIINSYDTYRLYHVPFNYEINVENQDATFKKVVVRVYVVASDDYGDRRKWVALDQFYTTLPEGQKTYTISRSSSESTILQRAVTEEWPGNWEGLDSNTPSTTLETYCKCGLPRNLLLPRGSKEGMKFKLCVVVTDARHDIIIYNDGTSSCCDGNIYCGTYNKPYPFRLDMGFPFNRGIPNAGDTAAEKMDAYLNQPNIYTGDITIQWIVPKVAAA
ncbi:hypothetical protein DFA_05928 [Cavenderia fasciculata]|uniref:Tyrosinase copper-binding domain-containing protein n=1 Tax=Cavenderia fasciculata TaxID=261658 RepID=F4PJL8_CACFS|nr:uncharacterized protein DFA_05928 [Cavenderia fasciculata]EGG23792.1 hypothetical protein DFA_05928 [Cavenderia fasciculata]|eukprot:XP_004361643.1 hypothetical protein DFA_05928 [Cavenderia fasciculata]